MRVFLLVGLLGLGTLASAANLSIDFAQTPTFTVDSVNSLTFSSTPPTFTGTFISNSTATGSDNVAIVDPTTGELLDTIAFTFSGVGNMETFNASVVAGIDAGTAPAGYISENATGSSVDITSALFAAGAFPQNITLQETANPLASPEPASLALIGLGLAGLSLRRYVKK